MSKKKKIQPLLRFKDDKGNDFPDWEEKVLGDICSTFKSGNSITSKEINETGVYPVYGGNGLRGFTENFTHDGFYVLIGRQGALCGNINRAIGRTYISEHAIAVQGNENSDTEWLAQKLELMNLNQYSESSAQPGLAVNKLVKLRLSVPSLEEQKKIADFLSAIDNKIENLEKELEGLKAYKKGVMQAIFAFASDAKERRLKIEALQGTKKHGFFIRFKDENGNDYPDWELRKIEDVAMVNTGNKDTQDKEDNGLYPFFVRSDNVERINSYAYDGEAVLTSGDGVGVGKNFHYINGKFNYHQRVYSINKFKDGVSGKYVFYFFSFSFYKHVIKFSAKNSVDSVRREMITKMPIPIPVLEEQKKIAGFLSGIDDKIDFTNNQIKNTHQYKQALLQQLFN